MRQTGLQTTTFAVVLAFVSVGLEGAERNGIATGSLVLENALYRVEVEPAHGRLLRLLDKAGGIDLRSPLVTAENFRLLVSVPTESRNWIDGKDQTLSSHEASPHSLVLRWNAPLKDRRGETHAIAATMTIALEGEAVSFRFHLSNQSAHKVQEIWYPAIGGLLDFGGTPAAGKAILNPPPNNGKQLRSPFGQHSMPYPSQNMGFIEVDHPGLNRGMYIGAHDPIARFKVFNLCEAVHSSGNNLLAFLTHYPFTPPNAEFEGSPLVVQFHTGDWLAGGKQIYRPWFIRQFGLARPAHDWIRQQSFFQMIMIMLPEGNVNYRIRDIPQLARDGLKYGVTSLQIAGWQFGGHDNGYPYYEPDPRLGTYDDLKEAIRQVHEMGAKIYFFANIHVNNCDTQWYKDELKNYNFEWMSGHESWVAGWGMGTLGSRMGLTVPVMSFADPSFPRFADAQLKYFKKLAEIGADGIHIDKCFAQPINFNPRVMMSPDESPWEGTVRLVERINRECRAIHPDWRMSFETNLDRLLAYSDSTWWAGNMSIARRIFPELVETVGLSAPYDYITVNDAVRNGHAVMIDPHDFCRSMDSEPFRGLASYIRDVKTIRDALADYVFVGEPIDASTAHFLPDKPRPAGFDHAAYQNLKNGKRACIVTNRSASPGAVWLAGFGERRSKEVDIYRPEAEKTTRALPAELAVQPERLVIVVEH